MSNKTIRLDYFQIFDMVVSDGKVVEKPLDLSKVLSEFQSQSIAESVVKNKNQEDIILAKIKQHKNRKHSYWELQFIRGRESLLPEIVNENFEINKLPLKDDEELGESTSVIYDPSNSVMLMQRNRDGVNPSGIAEYFNKRLKDVHVQLFAVVSPQTLEKFNKNLIYRNVEVACDANSINENSSLSEFTTVINESNTVQIKMRFSVGRHAKRSTSLVPNFVIKILESFFKKPGTSKLLVGIKNDETSKVEMCDLIKDRCSDFITLQYDRSNPLAHKRIYNELNNKYISRVEEINKYLGE